MQRFKHLLPLALLGALLTVPALAQVPRQISYQGLLADGTGSPIADGPHTITMKLYDPSSAVVYTETQNVATIKGLFNVMIGSVTPIPTSLTFTSPYSLGISVDGGAELVPRTQLGATPYALNAATADVARGLAPGATGVVTSLNGASGDVVLQGSGGTTINRSGNTITISSVTGGGGSGIAGIQNSDGSLTITSPNGPVANISVSDEGIGTNKLATSSVTAPKISGLGASSGQVLTFNGTSVVWNTPSGFSLPYAGTSASNSPLFSITGSGTGTGGYFRNTNTAPVSSALYGEVNATSPSSLVAGVEGKSANGFGVIGHGGAGSSAIYGAVITTPTAGSFYAGTGVSGFSDVGHGAAGVTYAAGSAGLYGFANGAGIGVRGLSTNGKAGLFEITAAANTSNALEATTAGSGNGILGTSTATTGSTSGIVGEANSTSHGIGATGGVSGVVGRVVPTTPGGYSAGVRGINNGTSGTGIGVIGYQAGSGWGVYGETPSGFGVYGLTTNNAAASSGVRGETFSTNGIGVEAKYSGTGVGVALEVDNGAIRVAGVNKAAFVHTATVANKLSANGTDIDNPMCNGDPNAILLVTQKLNPSGIVYNNSPIGVYYNTTRSKWEIFNENNVAIPTNAQFNVLVIKQ
jgi:hypothetical protein